MTKPDIAQLAESVLEGNRGALARAITLVESRNPEHRRDAEQLLEALLPSTGDGIRIGVSGVPGVGKSSFIERFGVQLIEEDHSVAVLAVDPTSQRTGGSILGDKTRMERLSRMEKAFIRPSPAGETLGGVARRTREAMLVCEAAGFDVTLIETVGIGQSETTVSEMTDVFLLLLSPAGGDELQGIKKGVVELADIILVNKADGDLVASANQAAASYRNALRMLKPRDPDWQTKVGTCSAHTGEGIDEAWRLILELKRVMTDNGTIAARRDDQVLAWMWREVKESVVEALRRDPQLAERIPGLEAAVRQGEITPTAAARQLIEALLGERFGKAD
ncbi:MAG: methylmalonyl Co-A mutase-associated GTPase MeaB [Chromatiaceae bacterium]|nr:methylmalonyl Co-A mutase-associated GTPase MeaB [Chromatiaceae bacterium]